MEKFAVYCLRQLHKGTVGYGLRSLLLHRFLGVSSRKRLTRISDLFSKSSRSQGRVKQADLPRPLKEPISSTQKFVAHPPLGVSVCANAAREL